VDEHHAIVRAIKARKPDQARDRATEHVIRTIERTSRVTIPSVGLARDLPNSSSGRNSNSSPRVPGARHPTF
jgi:hypothetical protein